MATATPRRVCPACGALTPSAAPACAACGRRFGSEAVRNALAVVAVFVGSYLVWFLLQLV